MGTLADDDDLELGELDQDEEVEFPPPERRIVTQSYDLSVNTLVEQWDDDVLVIPPMQREYVWDNGRASRLIESLMLNIPVPPVFFSETADAQYEIIDGHQRIRSIVRYLKNELPLSGLRLQHEYDRLRFHQLPAREQRFLKTRVLRAIIISAESHPTMKFEIFQRLNTGAIALNAQEIRNALNQGPLNDLLHDLVRDEAFRRCLGSKSPRRRMVDQELVLRFLALSSDPVSYRPPLLRFLNDFMTAYGQSEAEKIDEFRESFLHAAEFNARVFSHGAFRPTNAAGELLERNVKDLVHSSGPGHGRQLGSAERCRRRRRCAQIRRSVARHRFRTAGGLARSLLRPVTFVSLR